MNKRKKIGTNTLVKASFLAALSIVLTRFASILPIPTLRIGFGEIPLMISGMLFGPIVGGIVGIASDLIGIMVNPQGPPHYGFTISSMLWGVIPGLYVMYFKRNKGNNLYSPAKIGIIVATCFVLISFGLNTYWLSQLYQKGILVMLPGRALSAIINIPIQSIIIIYLMKYLKGILKA